MPVEAPVIRAVPFEGEIFILSPGFLAAYHIERHVHVAAGGMRVGACLFLRFPDERGKLGLRNALIFDAHLHRETEPPAFTLTNGDSASDFGLGSVALLPLCYEVERPAEASGIARGEQVLRRGRARLARAAHLLGHRNVGLDDAVTGFPMP